MFPPKGLVVGGVLVSPPPPVRILASGTCECDTSHHNRDFVDVINLRILRWADYPGLWESFWESAGGLESGEAATRGRKWRLQDVAVSCSF